MKLTLSTIGSRYGSVDALNANFDAIEQAFEDVLWRDNISPNWLEGDIDANNNTIINLRDATNLSEAVPLRQITNLLSSVTGANNSVVYENDITITSNTTLTAGKNGMSAGPITIASGVSVTVPSGSTWSIV